MPLISYHLPVLYGGCSDFCTRCRKLCGRAPRKRKKPPRRLQKPLTLKYVRYPLNTVVTPGWGSDVQLDTPVRVPDYRTYERAVALRNMRAVVPAVGSPEDGRMVIVPAIGRKRKSPD
ncbi:ORF4 [Siadenovirus carbocapituli]|uniref:ORF4 n=1 Tax=Siadenovirus sp. TaxID=2671519 RepID=A0A9E7QY29_9ADEN|nr:ORF4 [Siadenovirus sp.]